MSAYIVQPEQAGLLAAWAVHHRAGLRELEKGERLLTARAIAEELIAENIKSVAHRYPSDTDGNRPGPCLLDAQIIDAAALWAGHYQQKGLPEEVGPITIAKLADCLEYQSCEHEGFKTSLAQRQINEIRSRVLTLLPGYSRAPWSWEDRTRALDVLIYGEEA